MIRKGFTIIFLVMGFFLESYAQHLKTDFVGTWRLYYASKQAVGSYELIPANSWKVIQNSGNFYQVRNFNNQYFFTHEGTYEIDATRFIEHIEKFASDKSWEGRTNYIPFRFICENMLLFSFSNHAATINQQEYWIRVGDLDLSKVNRPAEY